MVMSNYMKQEVQLFYIYTPTLSTGRGLWSTDLLLTLYLLYNILFVRLVMEYFYLMRCVIVQ